MGILKNAGLERYGLDIFKDCHLFISARSPFARRVRLALLEHEVPFKEEVVDLFGDVQTDCPGLLEANPLIRVPTVKLVGGQVLVDSHEILSVFYASRESGWMPRDLPQRLPQAYWSGLAIGICELTIDYFFEMQRPEPNRNPERLEEIDLLIHRSLTVIEAEMSTRQGQPPKVLNQADLDLGTALGYLGIRYPADWRTKYPLTVVYHKGLELRPSFKQTCPPAAT